MRVDQRYPAGTPIWSKSGFEPTRAMAQKPARWSFPSDTKLVTSAVSRNRSNFVPLDVPLADGAGAAKLRQVAVRS